MKYENYMIQVGLYSDRIKDRKLCHGLEHPKPPAGHAPTKLLAMLPTNSNLRGVWIKTNAFQDFL